MLMVRRTIGFILCHMLPMAAQTGPVSAGAPLFGLAHNHHGTHASQGHGSVCALKCACVCVCESRAYSRESLIASFRELVVRVTDTPLMLRREVYFHFLGHIKAVEGCAGAAQTSSYVWGVSMCAFSMHMCRSQSSDLQLKEHKGKGILIWCFLCYFEWSFWRGSLGWDSFLCWVCLCSHSMRRPVIQFDSRIASESSGASQTWSRLERGFLMVNGS